MHPEGKAGIYYRDLAYHHAIRPGGAPLGTMPLGTMALFAGVVVAAMGAGVAYAAAHRRWWEASLITFAAGRKTRRRPRQRDG
jgi:hypothetical protein